MQEAIIFHIAASKGKSYRLASPDEESQAIDGFIGDTAIQIKPLTYKATTLSETIDTPIIYYDKKNDGIDIFYEEDLFK